METNNLKLREALESIANNLENRLFSRYPCSATVEWMWQKARAALSAPPRQCDVGTGEEQTLRFHDFCESHRVPFDHSRGTMCAGAKCPAYNDDANCFFIWAQLPYEEGGAL